MIRNVEMLVKRKEKRIFILLKGWLKGDIVGNLIKPRMLWKK